MILFPFALCSFASLFFPNFSNAKAFEGRRLLRVYHEWVLRMDLPCMKHNQTPKSHLQNLLLDFQKLLWKLEWNRSSLYRKIEPIYLCTAVNDYKSPLNVKFEITNPSIVCLSVTLWNVSSKWFIEHYKPNFRTLQQLIWLLDHYNWN